MDMIRTLKVSDYRTTQAIKYNKLFLFLYYTNYRKVFFLLFIRSIIYIYIYYKYSHQKINKKSLNII